MITTVLVDDDPLVLELLASRLSQADDIKVKESFTSSLDTLHYCSSHTVNCVIADLNMPGLNGIDLVARLHGLPNPPACLVLTNYHDGTAVNKALSAGARGFLLKSAPAGN